MYKVNSEWYEFDDYMKTIKMIIKILKDIFTLLIIE